MHLAAEENLNGRNYVQRLVGHASFVMPVSIVAAIRVSRCDARWLDFWETRGTEAASAYWSGAPADDRPQWEYLFEGTISANEADDFERVRQWSLENVPPDLKGPVPAVAGDE